MTNLLAYIPVLNQRYLDWFKKHPDSNLFLISQDIAESLVPRLARNMVALPTYMMRETLLCRNHYFGIRSVEIFLPDWFVFPSVILPDEDVSHAFAEKYLNLFNNQYTFETIWARWDMTTVKRQSPVMADVDSTNSVGHNLRMEIARKVAPKSPDWWRRVGSALFVNGDCVAIACNDHYPTEYEADMMGDPRLNFGAGQPGTYLSLHSERAVISYCAKKGISTEGASLYVTCFPCEDCAREIVAAGITAVFFEEGYSALNAQEVFRSRNVKIVQVIKDPVSA
jgi:dCMP deaminase